MGGDKVFGGIGYMQDVLKMKITSRGTNGSVTNMTNFHTFSVCSVNLIVAVVLVVDGQLVELVGEVIGGASVQIPVGIYSIGRGCGRSDALLVLGVGDVEAPVAFEGGVIRPLVDLANDLRKVIGSSVVVAVATASIATTTASIATASVAADTSSIAVATIATTTSTTAKTTTATRDGICRGLGGVVATFEHSKTLFKIDQLRVKFSYLDWFSPRGADGRDKRDVVVL